MNHQELRDFALQCSLEHHLCNVEELLATKTINEIMAMVEKHDNTDVVIYQPYEYYETPTLVEAIEDMRGMFLWSFKHVLRQVNGAEWVINFKGEA